MTNNYDDSVMMMFKPNKKALKQEAQQANEEYKIEKEAEKLNITL